MGFKRKDIDYLVLLRDLHETKCPDMKRSYKRIINVYKLSNSIKIQKELKGLSEVEHTASLVLNNLDKKHKKRALEQIYINGLATLDRKNNNFLKKLLDELNNYL
jgi:hypothetical protein